MSSRASFTTLTGDPVPWVTPPLPRGPAHPPKALLRKTLLSFTLLYVSFHFLGLYNKQDPSVRPLSHLLFLKSTLCCNMNNSFFLLLSSIPEHEYGLFMYLPPGWAELFTNFATMKNKAFIYFHIGILEQMIFPPFVVLETGIIMWSRQALHLWFPLLHLPQSEITNICHKSRDTTQLHPTPIFLWAWIGTHNWESMLTWLTWKLQLAVCEFPVLDI